MRIRLGVTIAVVGLLSIGPSKARADQWDVGTSNDDSAATTENELVHGSEQTHDLAAHGIDVVADQDWYLVGTKAYTSWEVVIDATTADIGWNFAFSRYDHAGTTLLQTYLSTTGVLAYSKFLAWENTTAGADIVNAIVVRSAECGTACDASDTYRIRAFETTIAIPRYNNSGGQVTVLICQTFTNRLTLSAHAFLFNEAGNLVTTIAFSGSGYPQKTTASFNLSTVNAGAANNTRGSIVLTHDGRFGDLVCKAVALEPATGFSFDSPGLTRPR